MSSRGVQAPTEGRSMSMRPQTGEQVRDAFHRRLDQRMNEAVDAFRVRTKILPRRLILPRRNRTQHYFSSADLSSSVMSNPCSHNISISSHTPLSPMCCDLYDNSQLWSHAKFKTEWQVFSATLRAK